MGKELVQITLTNKNPSSAHQLVHIDIDKGSCSFENGKQFPLKELFSQKEFVHPLLSEPCKHPSDHIYHYQYDNLEQMLRVGIFIYAHLLQAAKPQSCVFKIAPSSNYQHLPGPESLLFSINQYKKAEEAISLKQLEGLVGDLLGLEFKYSEDVLIQDELTLAQLPARLNGDDLYESNQRLIDLLIAPPYYSQFEIRYISPEMGLGIFSTTTIKKGTFVAVYTGIKKIPDSKIPLNFAFMHRQDSLMMLVDARQHGNIARFCNHAPKTGKGMPILLANLKANIYKTNGLEFVIYVAKKTILPGEQLLVDYGKQYFVSKPMLGFLENGKLVDPKKKSIPANKKKKIKHLREMAAHDIKKAQSFLLFRTISLCVLVIAILETFVLIYK